MAKYLNYRYIFPPRPKNAIPDTELEFWDNGSLIAQPKLNGSNCVIFTNGVKTIVMNRHNQRLTNFNISDNEIKDIYRGEGWMILNGEYMNKSKSDENNQVFNHKFVIFDILGFNSEYLVGKTFEERIQLLNTIYGQVDSEKEYLFKVTENVYRVKSYQNVFKELFDRLTQNNQLMEGLVLKRKAARLELGTSENNNTKSQIKCRVATKNYKY
jgi:hypothetical protein